MKTNYIRSLIFISFYFSASFSYAVQCVYFLNAQNNFYTAEHFPQSTMWIGKPNFKFTSWSVDQTNSAAKSLKAGDSANKVLADVALARKDFETEVTYPADLPQNRSDKIGLLRQNEEPGGIWTTGLWHQEFSPSKGREKIAAWVFEHHPNLVSTSYGVSRTYYMLKDGSTKIPSTFFSYTPEEGMTILHPQLENSHIIMKDALERIESFRKTKDLSEFSIAMQGYFNAMPYQGGSASIGRIFFSSLFFSVYDKPIRLHEDIDIAAMHLSRENFIELIANAATEQQL